MKLRFYQSLQITFVPETNLDHPCGYYCFLKKSFPLDFFFIPIDSIIVLKERLLVNFTKKIGLSSRSDHE